jgi:type IV pilus assembly protein PilW
MRPDQSSQHAKHRNVGGDGGFSLLEMLIVIAVMSIVLSVAVGSFDNMSRFFSRENVKSETQKKARFGLEVLIADIQLAGLNPRGGAGGGIQLATPTSIRVASDLNFDGDFDDASETITYTLNGNRLEQTNHLGTEAIAESVSSFLLTYFDRNGNQLPEPINISEVRSVEVLIALAQSAGRDASISRNYSTRIRCRNL